MANFLGNFFLIVLGATSGGIIAGVFILYQIKRNFFKPKLYFKNVKIAPTKGEIKGSNFKWGGLIFTGELCNDSDYWAYNIRIHDIYAEFLPKTKTKILNNIPLRLATDLPRLENYKYFENNTQLQNIKPGDKIITSVRILTKEEISLIEYKQLIKELKMMQMRTRLIYENSSGFISTTYFWLDFQYARFINLFGRGFSNNKKWKNYVDMGNSKSKIKSEIVKTEMEPY